MPRRLVPVLLLTVALAACAAEPAAVDTGLDPLAGQPIDATSIGAFVGEVTLPDASRGGAPFAMTASEDGILVVYFGFTSCPDICPTTLADLRSALSDLGDDAERVDVAMVTVDPERDSDETMVAYLGSFIEGGHPLRTASQSDLQAAADAFGASFDIVKTKDSTDVFHTAYLYAVDTAGTIRIIWPFGAEPDRIANDLAGLLAP